MRGVLPPYYSSTLPLENKNFIGGIEFYLKSAERRVKSTMEQ